MALWTPIRLWNTLQFKGSIIRHTLDSRQLPLSVESHILSNGECDLDIDRCKDCLKILSRLLLGFSNYLYKCGASSLSSSLRLLHFLRFLHSWLQNDWAVTLSAAAPHYKEHSAKQRTLHVTHYCTVHVALQGLECKLNSASCSHTHKAIPTLRFQLLETCAPSFEVSTCNPGLWSQLQRVFQHKKVQRYGVEFAIFMFPNHPLWDCA